MINATSAEFHKVGGGIESYKAMKDGKGLLLAGI